MKAKSPKSNMPNPGIKSDESYLSDPGNTNYNSVSTEADHNTEDKLDLKARDNGLNDRGHLDETSDTDDEIY